MSSLFAEKVENGQKSDRSLRDELTSLRIERAPSRRARPSGGGGGSGRRGGNGGIGLLSALLWLIPLGLVGAGGYFAYLQYEKIQPRLSVRVARVRAMTVGEAQTLLGAKGYLKSRYQAMIGAKVPGRVEKMLVEEGTEVKQGDLIAVLEHDELQAQLESRRAMVARSRAEIEEIRADLDLKRIQADRNVRLRSLGQISEEEKEQAVAAYRMTRAKLNAFDAAIRLQESMVAEVEATIADMHIVAPFDGTIVVKAAEVGETITPGGMGAASGRGSVVTLANLRTLEVETDIAENQLAKIDIGQPAEIAVSAVPDTRFQGRLRRIVPMGDRARGTIKVYVEVVNPDGKLFPELLANVYFLPTDTQAAEAGATALYVPGSAIVEREGATLAWVVDGSGLVRPRPVKASREGDRARVEDGLAEGETVVLDPPADLAEGAAVQIDE